MSYLKKNIGHRKAVVSVNQPIPGRESEMARNNAGGMVFVLDDWKRLLRFLILGTEGGTYYQSEKKLTTENVAFILKLIKEDGIRVIDTAVDVSINNRAPKNDPAILVLAMAASFGSIEVKRYAFDSMPKVCRTGTHYLTFADLANAKRGWGKLMKQGTAAWMLGKRPKTLAMQIVKYAQRNGWAMRDVARMAHIYHSPTEELDAIIQYIRRGEFEADINNIPEQWEGMRLIWASERAKTITPNNEALPAEKSTMLALINNFNLPRESVPTPWLNDTDVWSALLKQAIENRSAVTMVIRNLATMTRVGLLTPFSEETKLAVNMLADQELLLAAKIHPIAVLTALMTYQSGRSEHANGRGATARVVTWTPVPAITAALDKAFYLCFPNVQPMNKDVLFVIDTSGSMTTQYATVAGVKGLSPVKAGAALALQMLNTEPNVMCIGVDTAIRSMNLHARMSLAEATREANKAGGGTNLGLALEYAINQHLAPDVIVIVTDNEVWRGVQPVQLLKKLREQCGKPVRLAVIGMTATGATITDQSDPGCLDVVGFDTAAPALINEFGRGGLG